MEDTICHSRLVTIQSEGSVQYRSSSSSSTRALDPSRILRWRLFMSGQDACRGETSIQSSP